MTEKKTLPKVLYRFDLSKDRDDFVDAFGDDFELLVCETDLVAEDYMTRYGTEICAIVLDQESVFSGIPILGKKIKPDIVSIQLHHDIALDAIVELLDSGKTDKCFAKPYDPNIVRSEIYTASMGVNRDMQTAFLEGEADKKYTVLFVDDETIATKFLSKQLKRKDCPCEIKVADSAEQALTIFAEHKEDIAMIISDQRMPGMQGNQLLSEIQRYNPHIIRMLTSAYEEVDIALNAVNEGQIFRYIKKPWDGSEINAIIKLALFEFRSRLSQASQQQANLNQQYDKILQLRQHKITEILQKPLDESTGTQVLHDFLGALKTIHTVAPSKGSLRASQASDIETELVAGFTDLVLDYLKKVSGGPDNNVTDSEDLFTTLSRLIAGSLELEPADNPNLSVEFLNCLLHLLRQAGFSFADLEISNQNDRVVIASPPNMSMYKHILSPYKLYQTMIGNSHFLGVLIFQD